ncbi:hypothetical protein R3P38DRAFT_2527204 [Favolaschia claudopus]|uniref:Integrase catalytic domain-containing protein n=1 Tax=Favolaschia claudopus TaxID=2862362 RepID=A0AAW0BKN4_9AGAR
MPAFQFPENIPDFPPSNAPWPANVITAHQVLNNWYHRALEILLQEDSDPLRYKMHSAHIIDRSIPVLEGLEAQVPREWIDECANLLGPLVYELEVAALAAEGMYGNPISCILTTQQTQRRGRPAKHIDPDYLKDATAPSRNIKLNDLAAALKVHRHTLRKRMRELGLKKGFDDIGDQDLDAITRKYKAKKPTSGLRYLRGHFRRHGLRIQRERARHSLKRVDALGQALRSHLAINRRRYKVPRPNYLWHCDGHHKLIWWGIVIHGFVDGYCRTITGLRASTNNLAATVLEVFMAAIQIYGTPYRLRGDRGGENTKVAIWMVMYRGPGRASFMWGSSTRNTRIERLWVEVGTQFARRWRAFFTRLGRLHRLDRKKPSHLWLLHHLFLSEINNDCSEFQKEWNHHPLGGRTTNDNSPVDIRFLGQTTKGLYDNPGVAELDPLEGIHPDAINRYYGVAGREQRRRRTQTGAGIESDDEQENDEEVEPSLEEELENRVEADLEHNIRHQPVKVAQNRSPFQDADDETHFLELMRGLLARPDIVPDDYGVTEVEWEGDGYPEIEVFRPGTKGKEMSVILPRADWYPRAVQWAQALDLMTRILHELEVEGEQQGDSDSESD